MSGIRRDDIVYVRCRVVDIVDDNAGWDVGLTGVDHRGEYAVMPVDAKGGVLDEHMGVWFAPRQWVLSAREIVEAVRERDAKRMDGGGSRGQVEGGAADAGPAAAASGGGSDGDGGGGSGDAADGRDASARGTPSPANRPIAGGGDRSAAEAGGVVHAQGGARVGAGPRTDRSSR